MAEIKTVGVIGAGQMGTGIAHVCALAGYDVLLNDISAEKVETSLRLMRGNMARQVAKGIIDQAAMDAGLTRVKASDDIAQLGAVDIAIEAATENEDAKKAIFKSLQPHLKPSTLLASNTSSISITRLASTTDRPEHFIGLHFMNPVPIMKLVEIIRGIATDAPTYETAVNFAQSLGKKSGRGFYDYRGETPIPTR